MKNIHSTLEGSVEIMFQIGGFGGDNVPNRRNGWGMGVKAIYFQVEKIQCE